VGEVSEKWWMEECHESHSPITKGTN